MASCEKILIAGFSGAGKSSFLKEISSDCPLGWGPFDDLDQLIQKKQKMDVHGIVQLEGWDKFRQYESQVLLEWLQKDMMGGVLALGGGTLNKDIYVSLKLTKKVRIVYLQADFETCWKRVNEPLAQVRPLVKKGKEELLKLYSERKLIYDMIPWKIDNPEGTSLKSLARQFWLEILAP
jgi:shikimate kinase